MANRPGGLLVYRDELAGWFTSMGRYAGGSGADRAFWLETYNGHSYRYDRKGAGEVDIPHAAAAVLGGIQPERVKNLALDGQQDGLSARFMWIYPDPVPPVWPKDDFDIERRLGRIFERLSTLESTDEIHGSFCPVDLPLTSNGEASFITWRVENYEDVKAASGLYAHALGKYPGTLLRIACVLEHLAWADSDRNASPKTISDASITAAISILDRWAKPHLARVIGEAGSPRVDTNASTLARFILHNPCEKFNASTLRRKRRLPGLEDGSEMDAACEELAQASWIRSCGTRQGDRKGRTSKDFEINPKIYPPCN